MTQDGFLLTLPNGDQFEATTNIDSTLRTESQFVFNGLGNSLALFEQFVAQDNGAAGSADGLKQSMFLGSGAGSHAFQFDFESYEGEPGTTWGGVADGASMETRRDTLDHALNTVRIDSDNTATLATGEYSSSGKYDPVDVVVQEADLSVNYQQETSVMNGRITFLEAFDVGDVNTATDLTG
jgi:hypothetical protein